jgi:hypothetical protein
VEVVLLHKLSAAEVQDIGMHVATGEFCPERVGALLRL